MTRNTFHIFTITLFIMPYHYLFKSNRSKSPKTFATILNKIFLNITIVLLYVTKQGIIVIMLERVIKMFKLHFYLKFPLDILKSHGDKERTDLECDHGTFKFPMAINIKLGKIPHNQYLKKVDIIKYDHLCKTG